MELPTGFLVAMILISCILMFIIFYFFCKKRDQSADMIDGIAHVQLGQPTNHRRPLQPPTNQRGPLQPPTNQSLPGYLSSIKPYIVEDDLPPSYAVAVASSQPSCCASTVVNINLHNICRDDSGGRL